MIAFYIHRVAPAFRAFCGDMVLAVWLDVNREFILVASVLVNRKYISWRIVC